MTFAELIVSSHRYLSRFDYDSYPECFREFQEKAAPLLNTLDESTFAETALSLVHDLESQNRDLPKSAMREKAHHDKQVLALFLTPAAEKHSENAALFAEQLRLLWNEKYPKNTYYRGSFETIMKGFDSNLLGLPLRKSRNNRK